MEDIVKSPNFLFKYLTLELFEKLYRLHKYIKTCKIYDKKNNEERIISLFESSIRIIASEVNELCIDLEDSLSDEEKFALVLKISQHSKAISKIHEELKNLHSSWILPEIKTFTNQILGESSVVKNDIYIILSDHYSFLERNLGKKFESVLREVYSQSAHTDELPENHSFILPKIEFSNPLNWTIIVHEAGHLQIEIINQIRNNPGLLPDNVQILNEKILKNWAEEIYCDVYAISVLGPAYFLSFVTFALLSPVDYGIASNSDLHPSVILRATIMKNYLKDNSLLFKDEPISDYTNIFYACLISQKGILHDEPTKTIEGLTIFNSKLRKIIKDLNLNQFSINHIESKRIRGLLTNLKNGIPIGSVGEEPSSHILELLKEEDLTREDIEILKSSISERGTTIWEILNTGWVYKMEVSCNIGCEIFFNSPCTSDDIINRIMIYGETIDFLDDRLLASINVSQIIKIIEQ